MSAHSPAGMDGCLCIANRGSTRIFLICSIIISAKMGYWLPALGSVHGRTQLDRSDTDISRMMTTVLASYSSVGTLMTLSSRGRHDPELRMCRPVQFTPVGVKGHLCT